MHTRREIITNGLGLAAIIAAGKAPAAVVRSMVAARSVEMAKTGEAYRKALHYGIELVGSVQNNNGILSNFAGGSYGKIPFEFARSAERMEFVIEFTLTGFYNSTAFGIMSYIGSFDGFTPFYHQNGYLKNITWLSTNGTSWNIWSISETGDMLFSNGTFRWKCSASGSNYTWSQWENGAWVLKDTKTNATPSATQAGLYWQFGTNRGNNNPLPGTINLNNCYIINGNDLWWEYSEGAYERANGLE